MYWDFKQLWTEELRGQSFGRSSITVFESKADLYKWQYSENPYIVVWLHGMHQGPIDAGNLRKLQRRLERRVIFVVPTNPEQNREGMQFSWGCTFTKKQNRQDLGYVNGDLCEPYLAALTSKVNETADHFNAERVLVMGYSMGGFGALQLGCHAPEAFDAVVSVAGYGMGTLESTERSKAPQPKGRRVFKWWLDAQVPRLADVPTVMGVHSRRDSMSSFDDVNAIIDKVIEVAWQSNKRCHAHMVEVHEDLANSDYPKKKRASASGHGYFGASLTKETSKELIWDELRHRLSHSAKRIRARWSRAAEPDSVRASRKRGSSDAHDLDSKRQRRR